MSSKEKKNAMVQLIQDGEGSIYSTQNVLARIWRIVLVQNNITVQNWHSYISRYQERCKKFSSKKGTINMKGNMSRRLAADKLSWSGLMRGFNILEYSKVTITVELEKGMEKRKITIVVPNDELNFQGDDDETETEKED